MLGRHIVPIAGIGELFAIISMVEEEERTLEIFGLFEAFRYVPGLKSIIVYI